MFKKILIANRGEIACRIIRTARRLGIRTVAVYSSADAKAMHVAMADEAHLIGAGPPRESYLSIARILEAARASSAQAIHPGYGFLSENAEFAEACAGAGLVFIGPSAAAIRAIGDKAHAKTLMQRAGVPIVPGYHGDGGNPDEARFAQEAARLGYPVLVKAVAGGGGRGMRIVTEPSALGAALASAKRVAEAAFGDGRLILERYLTHPRHVEVQVFGDHDGNVVHLFERDCSAQRRHQKVIEEAPAPDLDDDLRRALAAAAVTAARAVDYVGAGTIEFILQDGAFSFIEMNTRLQVEHPVTEMITGHDLVEWQFRVAAGEPLPVRQDQIHARGHAVEVRLYAEDPLHDFAPAAGTLREFRLPPAGPDLRIETGMREGDDIPIFYDALLAKLVVWGADRTAALAHLAAALADTRVAGVANNRDFLLRIAQHPEFIGGAIDTTFIARHHAALVLPLAAAPFAAVAAATLAWLHSDRGASSQAGQSPDTYSPWTMRDGWRLLGDSDREMRWQDGTVERHVAIRFGSGALRLSLEESTADVRLQELRDTRLAFDVQSTRHQADVIRQGADITVTLDGHRWRLRHHDALVRAAGAERGSPRLVAPVQGRVTDVLVAPGTVVKRGQVLMLLECMKLEYRVTAPADGIAEAVHFARGDVVGEGALLITFAPAQAGAAGGRSAPEPPV